MARAARQPGKADLRRAPSRLCAPDSLSTLTACRGTNSLLKYLPVPDVTKLQKHGSIFIQKEGEVTHFIEANLAATPKDKETGQNTSGLHSRTRLRKDMRIMRERRGSITRISRGS